MIRITGYTIQWSIDMKKMEESGDDDDQPLFTQLVVMNA